jgi:hypothetical protein
MNAKTNLNTHKFCCIKTDGTTTVTVKRKQVNRINCWRIRTTYHSSTRVFRIPLHHVSTAPDKMQQKLIMVYTQLCPQIGILDFGYSVTGSFSKLCLNLRETTEICYNMKRCDD